jgi:hypothetical protein
MAQRYQLEVAGEPVGSLEGFHGLDVEAEIVARGMGPNNFLKKHVASVRWSPGVATCGSGMGKGMYGWIAETLDGGAATRNGSVRLADPASAVASLDFAGARLTAVGFPGLDGSSKDPASVTVEFVPRQVVWSEGGGAAPAPPSGRSDAWRSANFRVEIAGLPCDRVARVEAFAWLRAEDGTSSVPDVRLAISRTDYEPWEAAARRWFIDRDHRDKHEMNGRIVLLSPDLREELAVIELENIGFRKFCRDDPTVGDETAGRFAVEFYVEKIGFRMPALDA